MTKGFYQYGADPDEVMLSTYVDREHDVDTYCFLHGMCSIFAVALHREFGYPIYVLRDCEDDILEDDLIHAFCFVNGSNGKRHYVDARGVTGNTNAFLDSFGDFFNVPCYQEVSEEWVEKLCRDDMGEETYQFFLNCANQLIALHMNYYNKEGV